MLLLKKILPFSLFLFTFCFSIAQQVNNKDAVSAYRAIHWTTQDGLSNDNANIMIKDSKGFLWIGSQNAALCRFDGARFKKFIPDPHKRGSINATGIFGFTEDSLKNIWIGTDKGLSRYDLKADTFTNFTPVVDSAAFDEPVIPFWSTSSHVYCLESGSAFVSYDIHTLKRKKLVPTQEETIHVRTSYIIFDSASNCLWMLETYSRNPDRGGLLSVSLDDGTRAHYSWPCFRNNVTHRHSAEAMQLDSKRNSIWINTGDGLIEFTLADKQFHHIGAFNEYIKLKGFERWVGIDIDKDGNIWLATQPKGVLIYDPKTEQVRQPFSDPDLQKNAGDANMHIYCDRDGIVWTSNLQSYGIYELLPFNPSLKRFAAKPGVKDSLSSGFVISIVPASQGKMWIGTLEGLNIFDPVTEKFEVLWEKDLPGIRGQAIAPLYVDTVRQKAWLYAGSLAASKVYEMDVYEMDIRTRKCRKITFRDGARQFDSLAIDLNMVRRYKNGILVLTDYYGVFEIKEGSLFADLVVPVYTKKMFNAMALEEERSIFLKPYQALPNFNFENKNGKWVQIPHPLDSLDWFSMIYNEKDKTHWASFKYKLVHYDKDFREIKSYSEEDGYTGQIYKMIIDNKGDLWFINDMEQVGRLDMTTGIITMLSETDGYHRKDFDWSVPFAKDARGNLYFGTGYSKGSEGLDCIYPDKFVSASPSSVYFRSFTVNQKPFRLSAGVNSVEELSLRYNQNTINIETGIIDFYAKGNGNLRYKLVEDGKDEDWQYGPAYNTVRYDGLRPGTLQTYNAGFKCR